MKKNPANKIIGDFLTKNGFDYTNIGDVLLTFGVNTMASLPEELRTLVAENVDKEKSLPFELLDCAFYSVPLDEDTNDEYIVTMDIRLGMEIPPALVGQVNKYRSMMNVRITWSHFILHYPGAIFDPQLAPIGVTCRVSNYCKLKGITHDLLHAMMQYNIDNYMTALPGFDLIINQLQTAGAALRAYQRYMEEDEDPSVEFNAEELMDIIKQKMNTMNETNNIIDIKKPPRK